MRMNVFQYAETCELNWRKNLAEISDFRPKYTFYYDFSIAEFCEVYMRDTNAVKNTFKNVLQSWGGNIKSITEVCMALNYKIWSFYYNVDSHYLNCGEQWKEKLLNTYNELYEKCNDFIFKKYGKDNKAMEYFYRITD